ncbi:efflux RND transporter periplasmic adaptor subunit [Salinimicrobium gaetbulicola]|uniref:Efflux RND transporter periplasmic adaptor subunit n=1 Tax=Salinimicrobium gaetbulicola TaxID=999702 RepID=A0ABW3IFJ3_9FLAO
MSFTKARFSAKFDQTLLMFRQISILLLCMTLISCSGKEDKIYPKKTMITESVYSSVTIQPDSLYQAFAIVNGILDENLVEEGDPVKKGDPIAQIINNTPKLNAENARMTLELARKNYSGDATVLSGIEDELKAAELQFINDSINYNRQKKLWAQGIGSKSAFESRQLAYEISFSNLDRLQNKYKRTRNELRTLLQQAENNYRLSQINTTDFTVKSKINGKVYALHKKEGEIVTTSQPIASVGCADNFVIEMLVDEVDIVKIQKGQSVLLTLDSYPGEVFQAEVSKIYPKKDERNQTFLVEAIFEIEPKVLYPGLSGEANIIISQKKDALVIPRNYLKENDSVLTEEGFVKVNTGLSSLDSVEIKNGITSETAIFKPEE